MKSVTLIRERSHGVRVEERLIDSQEDFASYIVLYLLANGGAPPRRMFSFRQDNSRVKIRQTRARDNARLFNNNVTSLGCSSTANVKGKSCPRGIDSHVQNFVVRSLLRKLRVVESIVANAPENFTSRKSWRSLIQPSP